MNSPLVPQLMSGPSWPNVRVFSTTRVAGHSTGAFAGLNLATHTHDAPEAVAANRQLLRDCLPSNPIWLEQVHGTMVFDADPGVAGATDLNQVPVADAAITTRSDTVLAVLTADCLPVVLASSDGSALGIAHAGWRGLAAGVLEKTLEGLRGKTGDAVEWYAWVGPAISQAHFEVGADVLDAFTRQDPACAGYFQPKGEKGKWLADLPAIARHRLQRAGLSKIGLSGECTYSRPDLYYSYRRASTTGRLATLAWLTPR